MITRRGLAAAFFVRPDDAAPRVVRAAPENEASLVTLPDGTVRLFFLKRGEAVCSIESRDGGLHWTGERREFAVPGPTAHACVAMLDRRGELHVFFLGLRGAGTKLNVDRFLDVWHTRTQGGVWMAPRRIWEGYAGSLRAAIETREGRIVLPFAAWVAGRPSAPPYGSNEVTTVHSDDGGMSWRLSPARLVSPCSEDYNGSNYGAVEPCLIELRDGRLWMLMRTQTGRLYESYSPDGVAWSAAAPTNFWSSNSPAALLRLRNGALLAVWNNCLPPPKHEGQGVYGGRDALHVALSRDEGKSWRGFREVYLDPTRNQTPPQRGDRATAYPFLTETRDGFVLLATGQGEGRRAIVRFHPQWILEQQRRCEFANGLEDWSVYESFGPAKGYWRDRRAGALLVREGKRQAMEVRHGAAWNFPALPQGVLRIALEIPDASRGAELILSDHFRDPSDADDGCLRLNLTDLVHGSGQLLLRWDESGLRTPRVMEWARRPLHGISYARFRTREPGGFRILHIRASAR